jgi:hypothetical protein
LIECRAKIQISHLHLFFFVAFPSCPLCEVLVRFDTPPPNALVIDARLRATEVCGLAIRAVSEIRGGELKSGAGV